ncbi:hypothetical protein CFOL_v3_26956, partial [Cephalotus follicularis]
ATWDDSDESSSDEDSNEEVAQIALMALEEQEEEESDETQWYLDSGCSKHMTGDKSLFVKYEPKEGGEVTFGDNAKGKIKGVGSIGNLKTSIHNVLFV